LTRAPEIKKLLQIETNRLLCRDAAICLRGRRFAVPREPTGKQVWVDLLGDDIVTEHAGGTAPSREQSGAAEVGSPACG